MARRTATVLLLHLLVVLLQGTAVAGEDAWVERRGSMGMEEAAKEAREAAAQGDAEALKRLTLLENLDAWLIVEQLLVDGEDEAALKLASARGGYELEKLAAYVKREGLKERRAAALARFKQLAPPSNTEGRAALVAEPESKEPIDTLAAVLLADMRASEHRRRREVQAEVTWLSKALEAAETLGWRWHAMRLLEQLARIQGRARELEAERATWKRYLAHAKALGDRRRYAGGQFSLAWHHIASLQWPKARAAFTQSIEHSDNDRDAARISACWINIGYCFRNEGQPHKAIPPLRKGLAIAERIHHARWRWNALDNLRMVQGMLGEHDEALKIARMQLAEAEARNDPAELARNHASMADAYFALHRYEDALRHSTHEHEAWLRAGSERNALQAMLSIGKTYNALGRSDDAIRAHSEVLRGARDQEDPFAETSALREIAFACREAYRLEEAREHGEQAVARARELKHPGLEAQALLILMVTQQDLNEYAAAVANGKRARRLAQQIRNRRMFASATRHLAAAYAAMGEPARAIPLLERSIAEMEAVGARLMAEDYRLDLARTHFQLGNHATALRLQTQAVDRLEALQFRSHVATAWVARGQMAEGLGTPKEALKAYERARALFEALADRHSLARCLSNIGWVLRAQGEHDAAREHYGHALGISEEIGDKSGVASTLGLIAELDLTIGDLEKALAGYERVLALELALGRQQHVAATYSYLGRVQTLRGEPQAALAFFAKALEIADARRLRKHAVRTRAWQAGAYVDAGKFELALQVAKQALVEAEVMLSGLGEEGGARVREGLQYLYAIGATAAMNLERPADVLAFVEAGRAGALLDALDKREVLRWKSEDLSDELRTLDQDAQKAALKARLAHNRAMRRGRLQEARRTGELLDEAEGRVRDVAARIQRELKRRAGFLYPRPQRLDDIQLALRDGQALVLYAHATTKSLAIVVTPDEARVVDLGPSAALDEACAALDTENADADPAKALARLRDLLVKPLGLAKDVAQVLISPYGPLLQLPFVALFDQPVTLTPSGTTHVLLSSEHEEPGEGILALGAPSYTGTAPGARALYYGNRPLPPLPATRTEVEAIGTVKLLGDKASEAELRAALKTRGRWRAVHLACHGLVDVERPLLSSLAITPTGTDDGFLTGLEVFRMEIPTDLIVLSACETGRGRVVGGEGIVGLTRAFMFAGAPRVICSLWKVPDEATAALMIRFYELWSPKDGSKGIPAAQALKQAQSFIQSQPKWKHPHYWAAWVLWGLPE